MDSTHFTTDSDPLRQPASDYRVPPGKVALTFDVHGRDPSTISINADTLSDLVDRTDNLVRGMSYQDVLHTLSATIKAADAGDDAAWNATIIGYWLALRHPAGGVEMAARLADALAIDGRAHITMHASRERGIAFALGDRFCDLDPAAHLARQAGATTMIVAAAPRRRRPGGHA
jgi:hypothetical protein